MSQDGPASRRLRIAAAGDIHCSEQHRDEARSAIATIAGRADLLLLAGDLTTHGEPEQAEVLAQACADLGIPVLAVLGNHDWHADRRDELVSVLEAARIQVLDRSWAIHQIGGVEVGIVGVKGFVGGFAGSHLPDFGEPLLREVYAETTAEVDALAAGLQQIVHCDLRIVLLHYAPTADTLEGEPEGIHAFLGSDRLAIPIAEYRPDLVLHGHAHAGAFEGCIGTVPVYNVAVHVLGRDFWIFDLAGTSGHAEVEVEAPPA
jgi:Icc-related predicted phosphoesterase